jgi:site-specific DNA-methyltransferase (cytosine-N4-specific)
MPKQPVKTNRRGKSKTPVAQPDASRPLYRTSAGTAYVGDSLQGMRDYLEDESVRLFVTSPPFALQNQKEYGNKQEADYVEWFADFAKVMWEKLAEDGSLVIDLGGAWQKGRAARSLYQFKLLIHLCEKLGKKNFVLAQEFYWYNPSKMPLPAQWVNVERCRVKDSVNVIWWLSKTAKPNANNTRVLRPYGKDMERLLDRQKYNSGRRPGGATVNPETWKKRHDGAIPPNVLEFPFSEDEGNDEIDELRENFLRIGGSESRSRYHRAFRALQAHYADDENFGERARKHPARFPAQVPRFFIDFLTEPGDLVVDAFAGSNATGQVAEEAGRNWSSFELHRYYLEPSIARFDSYFSGDFEWLDEVQPLFDDIGEDEFPTAVES